MPFRSKAQMRLFWAKDPAMAQRWADETPNTKGLPEHVGDRGKHVAGPFRRKATMNMDKANASPHTKKQTGRANAFATMRKLAKKDK